MLTTITHQNFNEQVLYNTKPVFVLFSSSECSPCTDIAPEIEKLSEQHSAVFFAKVNADKEEQLLTNFMVYNLPTILIFFNGRVIHKEVGVDTETINELNQLLQQLK